MAFSDLTGITICVVDVGKRNGIERAKWRINVDWKSVKSSNVEAVAHDPIENALHVRYRNGGVYRYDGIDADKHAALMGADSIGSFLHNHIKGKHSHAKVDSKID